MSKRLLTPSEIRKTDELYNIYKSNKQEFVKRYGKDAEKVMRGRTIKNVKKKTKNMHKDKIREMVKYSLQTPPSINTKEYLLKRDKNLKEAFNPTDTITIDIPLFIRMMEYDHEDAKSDLDLHNIAEKATTLSIDGKTLTMADYANIIPTDILDEDDWKQPDDESDMAYSQLISIKDNTNKLMDIIDPNEQLDAWVQAKLTKSQDYLQSVYDYLKGEEITENKGWDHNKDTPEIKALMNIADDTSRSYTERDEARQKAYNLRAQMVGQENNTLGESYVPDNIKSFAKRKGISSLVNKVVSWVEKVGAKITGGTAIGKNYNTLILDMGHQTGEIRINIEDEIIELYGKKVNSFPEFNQVYVNEKKQVEEGLPKGFWAKNMPNNEIDESYKTLVNKLKNQGKSEKVAKAIEGAIASYKAKGGGKGPTAKQMKEEKIDEKHLTPAEKKKKEDIVKAMKKTFKGPKPVMYAIATKKAEKIAEETLTEKIVSKLKFK
jgi:hypothetical protein